MINLKKLPEKEIYTFSIEGDIDQQSVERFYMLLDQKAQNEDKMRLLGIINEFPSFENFKAFGETMKMKAKAAQAIDKYAVLSDKDWIESLLPVGNFLTPGIPVKSFEMDERDEAIAWLEAEETDAAEKSSMQIQRIEGTRIYTFTINGEMDEAGMTAIYQLLKSQDEDKKVKLLAQVIDFDGFESFKTFFKGLQADFAAIGNVEKYAILSHEDWVKRIAKIGDFLMPGMEMKAFDHHQRAEALDWLKMPA